MLTVQGLERPDSGAARFAQLQQGFEQVNPHAQRNAVLHSLGTTMAAQAIADSPGLVDNAWFFGSAGVSTVAEAALSKQISQGTLALHTTLASEDWVAPLGRTEASSHPIDPSEIRGASKFQSDGGFVPEFGGEGEYGERTEGHNAREDDSFLYWGIEGFRSSAGGYPAPVYDMVSTGYLDPSSQSYKQLIVELAKAAQNEAAK